MAKIFFTIAPPPGEVLAKAREVGISLSKEQSAKWAKVLWDHRHKCHIRRYKTTSLLIHSRNHMQQSLHILEILCRVAYHLHLA